MNLQDEHQDACAYISYHRDHVLVLGEHAKNTRVLALNVCTGGSCSLLQR